jgi:alpha-glucosidase
MTGMMQFASRATRPGGGSRAAPWWKGAVLYQVYPRSFQDSDGDGVGDLPGLLRRLDHIASLGVDGLWLSPFFPSPMRDFGYDIADYCGVDPIFGTLSDFDAVVARSHALGLKVIIDQVWSHTSSAHPWFAESRASRTGSRADWYVWADPKPDGSPPSNWQSVFGGPAWTWDARRQQYYFHNFLSDQPDLNLHNPAVREAILDVARFWLARGVDGFRIDAINFAMHDPKFRNNPPAPPTDALRTRPFDYQVRKFSMSHPAIPAFLREVRQVLDTAGGAFSVAEVGGPDPIREMRAFTRGRDHLHSAYGFAFLYADRLTPALVARAMAEWPDRPGVGWPSWAFSNHDAPRAVSRWAAPGLEAPFARMANALLLSLRGNPFLYYGEELGLTQVEVPFSRLRDPEAIANWPLTLSRDGARTPMPWDGAAPAAGFSTGEPWLPIGADHGARAVAEQEADPQSLLKLTRRLVALRKAEPGLRLGRFQLLEADDALLLFERRYRRSWLRCAFNLSPATIVHPGATGETLLAINGAEDGQLPPYAARIERIT